MFTNLTDSGVGVTFSFFANDDGIDAGQMCCSCISPDSPVFKAMKCEEAGIATANEWRDAGGHSCKDYLDRSWCSGIGKGSGWDKVWGGFDILADGDGFDASDKCCDCIEPSDSEGYIDQCVVIEVVDGPLYHWQHLVSINVYASNSVIFLILLLIGILQQCMENSKKTSGFKFGITLTTLIGCSMFLMAKAIVYYGQTVMIWSETKAEKRVGTSIIDFTSKCEYWYLCSECIL